MKRLKSTAKLTLFSTVFITAIVFTMYFLLLSDINSELAKEGIEFEYTLFRPGVLALFFASALLSFFASSVIIDKVFNPVRLMIQKVKETGNMNFSKPLTINSDNYELKEYATVFNEMSQKLSGYIERQKQFISDVSHELVTPITIINGHSDLLLRRVEEHPEILYDELAIIKEEAARMGALVDSLLFLARSDAKKQSYTFENNCLYDLVSESVAEAEIIEPNFEFNVDVPYDITIKCDGYAIRRVLRIIISNAMKYTADNKLIEIKAHKTGGITNVTVKDYGIGIRAEHLPRIFDRFYRADESRWKKTGSSGLGLAIAKEIIDAHGGEISVTSTPEVGTVFNLILPH